MENTKLKKASNRNTGVDLLRCVAMFFVCMLHIVGAGGIAKNTQGTQRMIAYALEALTLCSVNCYAMISGYVNRDKELKVRRAVFMWIEAVFWLAVTNIAAKMLFSSVFIDGTDIASSLFPLTGGRFWYLNGYLFLFPFMPLLNHGLENITKQQHQMILLFLFVTMSFYSIVSSRDIFWLHEGYSGAWLVVLYVFGAYFRLYGFPKWRQWWVLLLAFLVCAFVTFGALMAIAQIDSVVFVNLTKYTSPFLVVMAACLLGIFAQIQIRGVCGKLISLLGKCSFGVYIIHLTPLFWNGLICDRLLSVAKLDPLQMTGIILSVSLLLFVGCEILSVIRYAIFRYGGVNWVIGKALDIVGSYWKIGAKVPSEKPSLPGNEEKNNLA